MKETGTGSGKKTKVAVLGGGIGALTSIYELTTLPENRAKYDITVYQLGWRLGGKGASGRQLSNANRIEEHGLHIWFGFYDNAFKVMREAYQEMNRPLYAPLATFDDAFKPHDYVVFMEEYKGTWVPWSIDFPSDHQKPGSGGVLPSFWGMVQLALGWLADNFEGAAFANQEILLGASPAEHTHAKDGWWDKFTDVVKNVEDRLQNLQAVPAREMLHMAKALADSVMKNPIHALEEAVLDLLCWLLNKFRAWLWPIVQPHLDNNDIRKFWILVDTAITWFVGMVKDKVLENGFFSIDNYDFREWMMKHGAQWEPTVNSGPPVRGIYDAAFAYENGNVNTPNFGAGSALLGALRIVFTYKGHVMYEMQAGMGDTVATPFYEVLKKRGVKFEFFHCVQNLKLSGDKTNIQSIQVIKQVDLLVDEYDPQVLVKDLPSWPSEPLWWQLKDGAALEKAGVNFEQIVSVDPKRPPKILQRGKDFDIVILGIPVKATEAITKELYANPATPQWKAMIDNVKTVQTQAYQVWLNQDLEGLGWIEGDKVPVVGTYVELMDTYADMSHLIPHESWRPELNAINVAYFCGAQPDTATQEEADALAYQTSYDHMVNNMPLLWTNLKTGTGEMQWNFFVDPKNGAGVDRFKAQFFRANWTATERYTLSVKGSTQYRLKANATGYKNLYICGDWIDNNFNSGCIEATVMSGMQCSQAICGYPQTIVGDDKTQGMAVI
jgi:uncharacterized protein with NAD-binding domain and iron-sulfur cluster